MGVPAESSVQSEVDSGFEEVGGFKKATTASTMLLTSLSDKEIPEGGLVGVWSDAGS